jgi:glutamate---cysteine ligase / carboxylate-amine ligase
MEHRFGSSAPFTVGAEEELLLVDPQSHLLAHVAERIVPEMRTSATEAGYEAYAAQVELRSPVCRSVSDVRSVLSDLRGAARDAGATLMGVGLHPLGAFGDVQLVEGERYRRVEATMRGLIRRTPESALHVHVGMPDPETAIRAYNGLRAHLPLLHGLSANSPWWFGVDSGLASARYANVRPYPHRGVPLAFHDFADYEQAIDTITRAGEYPDYTYVWWDVRPHPSLGTVEVREMDAQARLEDVAALAALVHSLARLEADRKVERLISVEAIELSLFHASRDGVDASIADEDGVRPLREVAKGVLDAVAPHARDLGAEDALAGVERILREGGGAGRQRAAYRAGGEKALLSLLVEDTQRTTGS